MQPCFFYSSSSLKIRWTHPKFGVHAWMNIIPNKYSQCPPGMNIITHHQIFHIETWWKTWRKVICRFFLRSTMRIVSRNSISFEKKYHHRTLATCNQTDYKIQSYCRNAPQETYNDMQHGLPMIIPCTSESVWLHYPCTLRLEFSILNPEFTLRQ